MSYQHTRAVVVKWAKGDRELTERKMQWVTEQAYKTAFGLAAKDQEDSELTVGVKSPSVRGLRLNGRWYIKQPKALVEATKRTLVAH